MKFLKRSFAGLSLRWTKFDPILIHVGFVEDKVSNGQTVFFKYFCQNHSI